MFQTPRCRSTLFLLICLSSFVCYCESRYDFDTCRDTVNRIRDGTLTKGPINNETIAPYIYTGPVTGLDANSIKREDFLTVTYEGCKLLCDDRTGLNDVYKAFAILTTWVLPILALFSNFPYDSLKVQKWKTLLHLSNWIGSPQSAFTTTIFNIQMIKLCRQASDGNRDLQHLHRDSYYVLSCMNQFEYPCLENNKGPVQNGALVEDEIELAERDVTPQQKRNRALLFGLLRPLSRQLRVENVPDEDVQLTRRLLRLLAFQLRMQRRRGVYPQTINIAWFLLAFIISLVTAFADLGDNATAHSLALGLLLSWLPVLVAVMIVDRNPTATARCQELVDRWLYNVNAVLQQTRLPIDERDYSKVQWWEPGTINPFMVGEFVGQGRRLRYCGVTNAVLQTISDRVKNSLFVSDDIKAQYFDNADYMDTKLKHRSSTWWASYWASQLLVSMAFFMAFIVSFRTPTVGLGCRSGLYLLYWLLTLVSAIVQLFYQEPRKALLRLTYVTNSLAAILLFTIMVLQVTGALNNCYCKASLNGGKSYGGYIDFENAEFYRKYFHAERYWAPAAAFGLATALGYITWALRRWQKNSVLWMSDEVPELDPWGERERVDLKWLM